MAALENNVGGLLREIDLVDDGVGMDLVIFIETHSGSIPPHIAPLHILGVGTYFT